MLEPLSPNAPVSHPKHGAGHVLADMGEFALVRFGAAIQQVPREELASVRSLEQAMSRRNWCRSASCGPQIGGTPSGVWTDTERGCAKWS